MNLLTADIVERFYGFLWPMMRISAFLAVAPVFSLNAFNLRLRILLALVVTWLIFPLHTWPKLDPVSASGLVEIANQLTIGVLMGLVMQIVVASLVVAGQNIATSMGLSMASMVDPNMGNVPVLSQLLIIASTLIFVGFGGHTMTLALIADSFESLPVGVSILSQETQGRVLRWSSMMFLGSLLIALPVVVTLLFINIGLGVVTRAAPSLNIFAVGFPAMILAGFLILFMTMGSIGGRIEWLWMQGFNMLRALLGG